MEQTSRDGAVNVRRLAGVLAVLAVACVLSLLCSRFIVDRIYAGDLFPNLFTNRGAQPIEHYYSRITPIVIAGYVFLGFIAGLYLRRHTKSGRVIFCILLAGDLTFCLLSEIYGGPLDIRVDGGIPESFRSYAEGDRDRRDALSPCAELLATASSRLGAASSYSCSQTIPSAITNAPAARWPAFR